MTDETQAVEPPTFPREVGTTFNAERHLVDEGEYNSLAILGVLVDDGKVTLDELDTKIDEAEAAVDPKAAKAAATPPAAPVSPAGATVTDNEGGGAK